MPTAKPPVPAQQPCELSLELAALIRQTAHRIFGDEVVVRNYGTDPKALRLHVECATDPGMAVYDFVGSLMTLVDHIPHVEKTTAGAKPKGDAKIAYRQGIVL
jgi:hypothetical protein